MNSERSFIGQLTTGLVNGELLPLWTGASFYLLDIEHAKLSSKIM